VFAGYRIGQFWRALTAQIAPAERAWLAGWLTPAGLALFQALPRQDQRHSLDVARALSYAGHADPDLLAAALLHDCAKAGAGLTVWHRTLIVLLKACRPQWLERCGQAPSGWRRPFWVHVRHAELGAARVEAACYPELAVWLIRHHHTPAAGLSAGGRRDLLGALQREDAAH